MKTALPMHPEIERMRGCCLPVAPPAPPAEVEALSALLKAVADPARLQILHLLRVAAAPVCVCDLTAALDIGQPTVSHHLARLKEAGLVTSRKRGVWAYYALATDLPADAAAILAVIP
jgi:ArsR family transcriptional regulator, arsenate/arsenite/antimonite-responsive transcriptional repressor